MNADFWPAASQMNLRIIFWLSLVSVAAGGLSLAVELVVLTVAAPLWVSTGSRVHRPSSCEAQA